MPDWSPHIRRRLESLCLSPTRENEIVEELSQHLEDRWQELVAGGASEDEATRLALGLFRDDETLAALMAPLRQAHAPVVVTPGAPAGRLLGDLLQDVRYAWRVSWRRPGFTVAAIFTLALGIGANSAIFSLVDAALLRTLPVSRPEELVLIEQAMVRGGTQNISRPLFEHLREERRAFSGVFAAQDGVTEVSVGIGDVSRGPDVPRDSDASRGSGAPRDSGVSQDSGVPRDSDAVDRHPVTPRDSDDSPHSDLSRASHTANAANTAHVQAVSGEYFQVLGTSAAIGRTFTPEDDRAPGAHPVAVISDAFWSRHLGADRAAVGRSITLAGQPFVIVGIARPGFFGEAVGRAPDIWVPLMMHPAINPGPSLLADPRTGWLKAMGRLQSGVTSQQAEVALALLLDRLKAVPGALDGMPQHIGKLQVADGSQGMTRLREQFEMPLRILAAAVGVVLLIACANVATMMLARASARQREMAIRMAVGANRWRLARQLLTESLLLAAMGGALGLLLSAWGSRMLLVMAGTPGEQVDIDVAIDARLLAFNAFVSLGAVILFGLVPALSASRASVSDEMKSGMRPTRGVRSRLRLSSAMVVAQVALALPLVAGAALLLQTLHNLRTRDLGFAADTLVQIRTSPEASGYTREQIPILTRLIVERLSGVPGVRAVSVSQSGFATGTSRTCCIAIPGRVFPSDRDREVRTIGVGPGYFATVGQRLRIGRDFTAQDVPDLPDASRDLSGRMRVAVVNEAFVRQFLGPDNPGTPQSRRNPIGQRFGWGNPPNVRYDIEVVGVVNDAVYEDVREAARPLFYFPNESGRLFVVRTNGAPVDLIGNLRREIRAVDPKLTVTTVIAPVMEDVERGLVREKLLVRLAGIFGALAVALAAIGLYGLMAYAVAGRTQEIGIRMALGAQRDHVMRAEVGSALRLAAIGIVLGIPAAIAAGRLIASQLFGVSASDPVTLVSTALLLTLVGGLAAYGPARRASRVDPIQTLRSE